MKYHAQGGFMYKSRIGVNVYSSLCGATDSLRAPLNYAGMVTCERCKKLLAQQCAEPDLGQMFDMAYEDQCRDACGL